MVFKSQPSISRFSWGALSEASQAFLDQSSESNHVFFQFLIHSIRTMIMESNSQGSCQEAIISSLERVILPKTDEKHGIISISEVVIEQL